MLVAHARFSEVEERVLGNDPAILRFFAMLGRDVFCKLILGMAPSLAVGFLSMYSALESGNNPEVVDNWVGEAVIFWYLELKRSSPVPSYRSMVAITPEEAYRAKP